MFPAGKLVAHSYRSACHAGERSIGSMISLALVRVACSPLVKQVFRSSCTAVPLACYA